MQLALWTCGKRRKSTVSWGVWPLLLTTVVNKWALSQRKCAPREEATELWLRLGDEWNHCCVFLMLLSVRLCLPFTSVHVVLRWGDAGFLLPQWVEGTAGFMWGGRSNCCDQSFCPDIKEGNWLENPGRRPDCWTTECSKFSASLPREKRGVLFGLFA